VRAISRSGGDCRIGEAEVVVLEAGPASGEEASSTSSRPPSMRMARALPPLPATCRRRTPGVPSSEPMVNATASPSRMPVTQKVATRAKVPYRRAVL
jgi:hypothetical protein